MGKDGRCSRGKPLAYQLVKENALAVPSPFLDNLAQMPFGNALLASSSGRQPEKVLLN